MPEDSRYFVQKGSKMRCMLDAGGRFQLRYGCSLCNRWLITITFADASQSFINVGHYGMISIENLLHCYWVANHWHGATKTNGDSGE